jgi:hypothetical protein
MEKTPGGPYMSRTLAEIPNGTRIADYISLGVLTKTFPKTLIEKTLDETKKRSIRKRELPADAVIYYVLALSLYMQSSYREVLRCLLEGIKWLRGPDVEFKITGKSGISQARTRLGWEPLKALHDEVVKPIATKTTKGAWYRTWQIVSMDGSTMDIADEKENEEEFGRPSASRGDSAYPQLRFVTLVENGTQVMFGTQFGRYKCGEVTLAQNVVRSLRPGMLCLADRNFYGFSLWRQAHGTGADLLWRVKKNMLLPREKRLPDGSYLSTIYETWKDHRQKKNGVIVRVIEYKLNNIPGAEPIYRLLTTILDHESAPAAELAALYHERWEIETSLDELKTHLRGDRIVLRSKKPNLVRQEFYGLLLTHFAIRGLMHEAALKANEDTDVLSYIHAVRVVRRKIASFAVTPPSEPGSFS